LVYYETFGDVVAAIGREKQIKSWGGMKKIALIESVWLAQTLGSAIFALQPVSREHATRMDTRRPEKVCAIPSA
jgi:hypothetical protein